VVPGSQVTTTRGEPQIYHCFNDCKQCGCEGHELTLNYYNTADVVYMYVDGRQEYTFDPNQLHAVLKAWKALR
jgi:hypothetical protein